jgi:hypothetical protein
MSGAPERAPLVVDANELIPINIKDLVWSPLRTR